MSVISLYVNDYLQKESKLFLEFVVSDKVHVGHVFCHLTLKLLHRCF